MTSHTSPPYLGHINVLSTQSSLFPTFLRAGYLSSLLIFSHLLSFHNKIKLFSLSLSLSRNSRFPGLILSFSSTFGKHNPSSLWLSQLFPLESWISYTNSLIIVLDLRIFKCSWVEHFSSSTLTYWNHSRWVHTPTFSCFLKFLGGEYKLKHQEYN